MLSELGAWCPLYSQGRYNRLLALARGRGHTCNNRGVGETHQDFTVAISWTPQDVVTKLAAFPHLRSLSLCGHFEDTATLESLLGAEGLRSANLEACLPSGNAVRGLAVRSASLKHLRACFSKDLFFTSLDAPALETLTLIR